VEHIRSTRVIVRTRIITCENPALYLGYQEPRTTRNAQTRKKFPKSEARICFRCQDYEGSDWLGDNRTWKKFIFFVHYIRSPCRKGHETLRSRRFLNVTNTAMKTSTSAFFLRKILTRKNPIQWAIFITYRRAITPTGTVL
jgi:hypothetical protein